MTTVEVFAPAKVNLALHVTGQRDDRYHELDTLVAFADVGDWLVLSAYEVSSLTVEGPEAAGVPADYDNIALCAVELAGPEQPVSVKLTKNLPVSSGIGGGSADAAAAFRGKLVLGKAGETVADRQWAMPLAAWEAHARALLALGADVPMCLMCAPLRARGIGEKIDWVELPNLHAVLVNPRVPVSTPTVFKALAKRDGAGLPWPPKAGSARELCGWLRGTRNDLEPAATIVAPVIGEVLKALSQQSGVLLARMSGSGATCFGIFSDQGLAEIAAKTIRAAEPSWWVAETVLGDMKDLAAPQVG